MDPMGYWTTSCFIHVSFTVCFVLCHFLFLHPIPGETLCMRQGLIKRSSGRYAYGRDYIETVATAAGFHIIEVETIDLRIAA